MVQWNGQCFGSYFLLIIFIEWTYLKNFESGLLTGFGPFESAVEGYLLKASQLDPPRGNVAHEYMNTGIPQAFTYRTVQCAVLPCVCHPPRRSVGYNVAWMKLSERSIVSAERLRESLVIFFSMDKWTFCGPRSTLVEALNLFVVHRPIVWIYANKRNARFGSTHIFIVILLLALCNRSCAFMVREIRGSGCWWRSVGQPVLIS